MSPSTLGWVSEKGTLDVASWVMGGAKGTGSSDSLNRLWEPFPCKKLETSQTLPLSTDAENQVAL